MELWFCYLYVYMFVRKSGVLFTFNDAVLRNFHNDEIRLKSDALFWHLFSHSMRIVGKIYYRPYVCLYQFHQPKNLLMFAKLSFIFLYIPSVKKVSYRKEIRDWNQILNRKISKLNNFFSLHFFTNQTLSFT